MIGGVYTVVAFASFGGILFGLDQGNWSGAIVKEGFVLSFCVPETGYDCFQSADLPPDYLAFLAWGSSLVQLGAALGAIAIAPWAARTLGRRETLFIGCAITIVGNAAQCYVTDKNVFLLARFVDGLGVGAVTYALPMFTSEVSPPEIRGMLGCAMQLTMVIGMLAASYLNMIESLSWKASMAMPIPPAIILCSGIFCFPRSPRFALIKAQRQGQLEPGIILARQALQQLRNTTDVEEELNELLDGLAPAEDACTACGTPKTSVTRMCADKSLQRRLYVANMLQWMQQLTGINAILSYGPSIFDGKGQIFGSGSGIKCASIVRTFNFIFTIAMMYLIDSLGRRKLLLMGSVGMGFSMFSAGVMAFVPTVVEGVDVPCAWAMLFCLCIYISSFAIGWGGVAWVYPSEIFPMDVKEKAMSTSVCSQWMANFVIAYIVPYQVSSMKKYGTFWFYSGCLLVGFFLVFKFVPETKGLSDEEIFALFGAPEARERKMSRARTRSSMGGSTPGGLTPAIRSTGGSQGVPGMGGAAGARGSFDIPEEERSQSTELTIPLAQS